MFPPLYALCLGSGADSNGVCRLAYNSTEGSGMGIFLTGILGVATIPLYEWWANGALWWFYRNTRMWSVVPVYIILGEFFIAGGLVLLIYRLEERPWSLALLLGAIQGFWIWGCYGVSFGLAG